MRHKRDKNLTETERQKRGDKNLIALLREMLGGKKISDKAIRELREDLGVEVFRF